MNYHLGILCPGKFKWICNFRQLSFIYVNCWWHLASISKMTFLLLVAVRSEDPANCWLGPKLKASDTKLADMMLLMTKYGDIAQHKLSHRWSYCNPQSILWIYCNTDTSFLFSYASSSTHHPCKQVIMSVGRSFELPLIHWGSLQVFDWPDHWLMTMLQTHSAVSLLVRLKCRQHENRFHNISL